MEVRSAQLYYERNAEVRWPEYWVAHYSNPSFAWPIIQVLVGALFLKEAFE